MKKDFFKKRIVQITIIIALVWSFSSFIETYKNKNKEVIPTYTEFLASVKNNEIKNVIFNEKLRGKKELVVTTKEDKKYTITTPYDNDLIKLLKDSDVVIETPKDKESNILLDILISWFPMILLIGVWIYFMKKSTGGGKGGLFGISKNKSTLILPENINVSFSDVVGVDEVKKEVQEVVDFLKNPQKFSKLGGSVPSGLLLLGSAGVGKTMICKAIAKEAGVPFYSTSGSSFVEMFAGLGAARVRSLFEEARKNAPCIIFIDEIDAIGGHRGKGGMSGASDEREQTLNQILVELDGMDGRSGVIIIGATNRSETLDPALLRPGRFDRHVMVPLPDLKGREQILNVHINRKKVPVVINLNLNRIARSTAGFSGAELENLVNEAAIMAARHDKKFVEQEDFVNAMEKIMMGPERKSMVMPENERKNTAYHESGHAVIAALLEDADPLHKVTIIPRGQALGVTVQLPQEDRFSHNKQYLLNRIAILMGGRLAEEIFVNQMTTGASNDIAVATNLARKMVCEWGMSDKLGMVAFGDKGGWAGTTTMDNLSQETIREIDMEVKQIIHTQYKVARNLLTDNKHLVEAMTKALLEVETIDDWQIKNIMEGKPFDFVEKVDDIKTDVTDVSVVTDVEIKTETNVEQQEQIVKKED